MNNTEEYKAYLNNLILSDEIKRMGICFKTPNKKYFYDTGTGKVMECTEEEYLFLEKMFHTEKECLNEDENQEIIYALLKENLLQHKEVKKLYTRDHGENLEFNIKHNLTQINLEVTEKCNLRCKYCIYNENCTTNRNFGYKDMSLEIAKASIDYTAEHAGDDIAVTFYGGEPLIKFDLIRWCVEYSKERLKGKNLTFNLTTNLTLMTKEMAEYFASIENFSLLCSLDGDEQSHNAYRIYKNGQGSFSDAIRGFKLLVEAMKESAGVRVSVNGVFAPPYTLEHVQRIYKFFDELEWLPKDMKIALTYPSEGSLDDREEIKKLIYDREGESLVFNPLVEWDSEKISNTQKSLKHFNDDSLIKRMLKIHNRRIEEVPFTLHGFNACCIPGARRLFISTDGKLQVCERVGTSPSIGNIMNGGVNIDKVRKFYIEEYNRCSIEECRNCWAINLCGICYAMCYDENGCNAEIKSEVCWKERRAIKNILQEYYEIKENNPDFIDSLDEIQIM